MLCKLQAAGVGRLTCMSTGLTQIYRSAITYVASGLGSSAKPLIFNVNRSGARDKSDWNVTCPRNPSRSVEE